MGCVAVVAQPAKNKTLLETDVRNRRRRVIKNFFMIFLTKLPRSKAALIVVILPTLKHRKKQGCPKVSAIVIN